MLWNKCVASLLYVLLVTFLHKAHGRRNLALHKPCEESSSEHKPVFATPNVVDGDLSSCSHTGYEALNWWMVDLLYVYTIDAVRIQNRVLCCQERLQNFTVEITVHNPKQLPGFPGLVGGSVCTHQIKAVYSMTPVLFPCAHPSRGRYIRVVKYGFEPLTLCEFEAISSSPFQLISRGQHTKPAYTSLYNAGGVLDCARRCWHDNRCFAFQYKDAGQVCELLDDQEKIAPGDQDLEWSLYSYI